MMGEMSDHIEMFHSFSDYSYSKENKMSDYLNSVEQITIDKVTQYGGKVNGKSYNYGKKYTGPEFIEGATYEARISTSPNGAKYVNEARQLGSKVSVTGPAAVVGIGGSAINKTVSLGTSQTLEQPKVENNPPRVNGSSLSPTEKDLRILVQGVLQATAQSAHLVGVADDQEFIARVKAITTELVGFIRNFK